METSATRGCEHGRMCDDYCPECEIDGLSDTIVKLRAEITRLTAENKRMAVEVEAWRSGRLWLTGIDLDGPIVLEVEGRDGPSTVCDTITEAVDALMKEE